MDFHKFATAVHQRLVAMSQHELFTTEVSGDDLYALYLKSFPEGTNPIYKTRTEHDCSCCKHFIRNFGNVVALVGGNQESIWNVIPSGLDPAYLEVAAQLNALVSRSKINGLFRTKEGGYGAETTRQLLEDKTVKNWNHFHGTVEARHHAAAPDQVKGNYATTVAVFKRGLEELKIEAIDQVLDLIDANSLYRGEEHRHAVVQFRNSHQVYALMSAVQRHQFVWLNADSNAARFRNTVIGTLVQDLSAGTDLETAVRAFETKVAPTNYKRPTALITPRMVQDALGKIKELGLESALERRFARIGDITVNNVLWAHEDDQSHMRSELEKSLMSVAVNKARLPLADNVTVPVQDFMKVLPDAAHIELMVQGSHMANFMALTAPVHEDSGKLFKWGNDFGWSYSGNITDSIRERVKQAGGNVTNAALRMSLAWFNYDDLDIHVRDPKGNHIYFADKQGKLDVDMNAGRGHTREPVENVSWRPGQVVDGVYKLSVNQYNQRETTDVGCTFELESEGQLYALTYAKPVRGEVHIAEVVVKAGKIQNIVAGRDVVMRGMSQQKWGINTETFVKVRTVMNSPNFWDDNRVGNKHTFFVLEGCKADEPLRGIYNEFLANGLEQHRKVFEVLGDKTKCPVVGDQLAGLGFSSTRGDTVTVRVTARNGARSTLNVKF